jgi:hypothetical protein
MGLHVAVLIEILLKNPCSNLGRGFLYNVAHFNGLRTCMREVPFGVATAYRLS